MIRGRIIGEVWATKKHPGLEGRKLVLVAAVGDDTSDARAAKGGASGGRVPTGEVVVAIDTLETRPGQEVLVSWGSGARNVLQEGANTQVLCDAAISAILAETFETGL